MKILNKKNILLIILSFVFALSTLVFASTATVRADDAVETPTDVFEMVSGASIRVGVENEQDDSGIRFMVKMSSDVVDEIKTNDTNGNVKLGFIITVKELFDGRKADESETPAYGKEDYIKSISRYVSYDNGGIIVDEDKIYEKDGFYWANAAVVKVNDLDIEYVAIAYYVENETYVYASFDQTVSRSVLGTASKVYLNSEQGLEEELEYLRKSEDLTAFGTESQPVQINDDNDIYALSTAVNDSSETCTYEEKIEETTQTKPVQFKLNKDVTVDWDFDQIGAGFGGEFVASENKVTIINGGTALTHIFEEATTENGAITDENDVISYKAVACARNFSLITPTEKTISRLYNNQDLQESVVDLSKTSIDGVQNIANYKGTAFRWKDYVHNSILKVDLNYTKAEVLEMGDKFNAVSITYLVNDTNPYSAGSRNNDQGTRFNIMSSMGYARITNLSSGNTNPSIYGAETPVTCEWQTKIVPLDEFLLAMSDEDTTTTFFYVFTTVGDVEVRGDIYLGSIDLIKTKDPILFSNSRARQVLFGYDPMSDVTTQTVVKDSEGNVISDESSTALAESVNIRRKATLISKTEVPTQVAEDNPITNGELVTAGTVVATDWASNSAYFAKLRYTKEQLLDFMKAENGGYKEIQITYMIATTGSFTVRQKGILQMAKANLRTWQTLTISIEDFTGFMGSNVTFTYHSSGTNTGYPQETTDETTGNVTTVTKTTYKSLERATIDDYTVMLSQAYRSKVATIYIADISFVPVTQQA